MWIGVITLFPAMFQALTDCGGVVSRHAIKPQKVSLECFNPRDFAQDKHKTVDDRPYGGGPGMILKVEPLMAALKAAQARSQAFWQQADHASPPLPHVILLSPQGRTLRQPDVLAWAQRLEESFYKSEPQSLILVAGRYEGIDERFIELAVDEEYSIGDYVLTGGELPAMVFLDAVLRLMPGVLGSPVSSTEESFNQDLLDCPHYTRPFLYEGLQVPPVLMSGDHQAIQAWRRQERIERTQKRRPDLNGPKDLKS